LSRPGAIVVGSGFGTRVHVPALRAAGFDVLALVGRDEAKTARRAERLEIPRSFTDYEAALALEGVAAVTIATPPATHATLAVKAARAGKHVVCEKPFSMGAGEAHAMVEAVAKAGVVGYVGNEFRWAPDRATAARAIADGVIGEPRFMSIVQWVPLVPSVDSKVPPWWFDPAAGGGWLGASGSHMIDLVRTWLGEYASVRATTTMTSDRDAGELAEDSFAIQFTLANGVQGVHQETAASWGAGAGMTRVGGTRGTLWLEGGEVHVADADGTRTLPVPDDLALPAPPEVSDDPRQRFTHLELGPYTRLCEALLAAVNGKGWTGAVKPATFADGLAAMEVIDAIRASAEEGGEMVHVAHRRPL
jgi:predicted dehydrogenase